MLLPAMTTAPFLAAGMHPVAAYNLVMVLSFIASAFAMYLLAEQLTGSPAAAFVAGLLFGFYPYRFEHYSHFELQMTYCMPLALLALHRFAATARMRDALAAGAADRRPAVFVDVLRGVLRAVCGGVLVFVCVCSRARPVRRLIVPARVAGALALAARLPLARTYSSARLGDRDADRHVLQRHRGRLSSRAPAQRDVGRAHDSWTQPERALFPGAVILILAALALVPPLGSRALLYAIALLVPFEMSRGFNSVDLSVPL